MRVLAAVDKFKGTATGAQVADAIAQACWEIGHECVQLPVADGGEGTLEALGGANRTSMVTGPLGDVVEAAWRYHRRTAVIEMARASGLTLVGGAAGNDAIAATTTGTGELIDQALDLGATRIVVCLGGSATTDGGLGCVRAITSPHRLRSVQLLVACDVQTLFVDAAPVFAPQKGATPAQVDLLRGRLNRLAQMYQQEYGVDVRNIPGTSADSQVSTAIKELETYKTMRGAKAPPGVNDEIDDLLNRAKAKQAELKNTVATPQGGGAAAPPAAAKPAAGAPAPAGKPDAGGGIVRDMP